MFPLQVLWENCSSCHQYVPHCRSYEVIVLLSINIFHSAGLMRELFFLPSICSPLQVLWGNCSSYFLYLLHCRECECIILVLPSPLPHALFSLSCLPHCLPSLPSPQQVLWEHCSLSLAFPTACPHYLLHSSCESIVLFVLPSPLLALTTFSTAPVRALFSLSCLPHCLPSLPSPQLLWEHCSLCLAFPTACPPYLLHSSCESIVLLVLPSPLLALPTFSTAPVRALFS